MRINKYTNHGKKQKQCKFSSTDYKNKTNLIEQMEYNKVEK